MISTGRTVAIAALAVCSGFVGGVWFVSSGSAFALFPIPTVPPVATPRVAKKVAPRKPPAVAAVGVPKAAHFSGGSAGLMPAAARDDLLPSPGCSWEVEPRPFKPRGHWHKSDPDRVIAGYWWIEPGSGGLRYLLVQATRGTGELPLRPVFFDEDANRMVPSVASRSSSRGTGGAFIMAEFSFGPCDWADFSKVAYFAIERVVPDAARFLVEDAQKRAAQKGIAILPAPRLGKPYPFDLVDVDARAIRQSDLKGKAVVISVSGPGPFGNHGLLVAKRLRDSYKPDELEFVNISFDGSAGDAKAEVGKIGLDCRLVCIPNDLATRRIWVEGTGIDRFPKCFVVDREGVLRFVSSTTDLEDRVAILFGRPRRPGIAAIRTARPIGQGPNRAQPAPAPAPEPKKP